MKFKVSRGTVAAGILSLAGGCLALYGGALTLAGVGAYVRPLLWVAAAVIIHETGHILAAHLCGVRMRALRVDLFGARLHLAGMMSYRREAAIAAAGPLFNLLTAAILLSGAKGNLVAYLAGDGGGSILALSSIALAAINLLPVRSLDGGRILRCTLAPLIGERAADSLLTLGTALCLGGLWAFSVYALLRVGEMLSLFAFSVCLLCRMTGE